jgi:2,3-bisphosphoglycerate-dependent phosphoglycerate mutase
MLRGLFMEILVIRHGQSEADVSKRLEGRADFPLTELGIQQAKHMAEWVKNHYMPDYILSSTLKRARTTAQMLELQTNIKVEYYDELMEFNNGLVAGLTLYEANRRYPKPEKILPHESNYEQETLIEFRARAESILSKIIYKYPLDKRIAIISHGGMINMLFRSFLNLPINTEVGLNTADTGIHLWIVDGNKRYIEFLNSTKHLID